MTVDERARKAAARQAEIDALTPERRAELAALEQEMRDALAREAGFIGITHGATANEALAKGIKAAMVDAGRGASLQDPGSVGAPPPPPATPPEGQPPHNDGMEARVARLEAAMEYVQRELVSRPADT